MKKNQMNINIALIGDYDGEVTAHKAIPLAIQLTSTQLKLNANYEWINTEKVSLNGLQNFNAIWCVPASPYRNMEGALTAITYARSNNIPFLGTCGGYQHAVLEFARKVLGFKKADNFEVNPETEMPLISSLTCNLVEKTDTIFIKPASMSYDLYKTGKVTEEYHCSYGVNAEYLPVFENSAMQFTGHDKSGEPKIMELNNRRFFMGTAYQPERSAFKNQVHPIITAFLKAAAF
jgi:CTP synthase (UTP-ammonia lyase)